MLKELLEAALPGRWTVIKRRVRTNVYPPHKPGYELHPPQGYRFREGAEEPGRYWGPHSLHLPDIETVKQLAANIGLAVERCPLDCECRKPIASIDGPCCL